ncbi:hypothetical protein [Collimonas sp.]|jgi:haloacetate dehalogenase|uniref:hypothetical protein n=1 Tax=Collimonas sp. TaxID=1963772 RepID=UPI0039C86555
MSSESIHHDSRDYFPGFSSLHVDAGGVSFSGVTGGSGPTVLLLHGYPQTHITPILQLW